MRRIDLGYHLSSKEGNKNNLEVYINKYMKGKRESRMAHGSCSLSLFIFSGLYMKSHTGRVALRRCTRL